jgi:basic amino acid/polyamine antiporter, APA family
MSTPLQRKLGLSLVTFYGLGTIVGAGIYVLIGEVANIAGQQIAWAFLLAGIIASLTGACYAELSSRFPAAAGAVLYIDQAFNKKRLSQFSGLLIILTGIVSAATISRGFVGYLGLYIDIPDWLAIVSLALILGSIAVLGVKESASAVALITILEVFGLLMVIVLVSFSSQTEAPHNHESFQLSSIILGSFLAFYAFIGFEDMVNLAEEMKSVKRDMPRAIFFAMIISTLLYLGIAWVAAEHTNLPGLASSDSPLAYMLGDHKLAVMIIGLISLVAITNGALTQIIMGSRVLYGMSRRNILPKVFGQVWTKTSTPVFSTLTVTFVILIFALWLPLAVLAKLTSSVMLMIFALVNLSLIRIKMIEAPKMTDHFKVPMAVPVLGLLMNISLLVYQLLHL